MSRAKFELLMSVTFSNVVQFDLGVGPICWSNKY